MVSPYSDKVSVILQCTQEDAATPEYTAPFQPARARKNRKNRKNGPLTRTLPMETFNRARKELLAGDWMSHCKQLIRESLESSLSTTSPEVLCLGLGSPAGGRDPRAQLAFLLEVCDDLTLDHSNISAYDPIFTEEDDQLLDELHVRRLIENRNAAYALPNPTIAYMPHCDLQLYERLLRENWSSDGLPKLLLIANRLTDYVDNTPSHKLSAEHPCVSRITPILTSEPLPPCPSHPTAFNNLAIQYVRHDNLPPPSADAFWQLPLTPEVHAPNHPPNEAGCLLPRDH